MKKLFPVLLILSLFIQARVYAQDSAFDDEGDDTTSVSDSKEDSNTNESIAPSSTKLSVSRELEQKFASAMKSKSEDRVVDAASDILGRDSDHLTTLNGLGVFYFQQKKYAIAKIIYQRALKAHKDASAVLNNLGVVYLAEGDMRSALETFKKCSSQRNQACQANLSSILVTYGDYEKAVDPLADAYGDVKKDLKKSGEVGIAIANNYAVALMGSGNGSRSESVFETIVESGVRAPEPYLNYAILLVDVLDKKSAAQKILSKIQFMTEDRKILRKVSDLERRAK